jgi:hypothetical protein
VPEGTSLQLALDRLADQEILVHGGYLAWKSFQESVLTEYEDSGVYGLSVAYGVGMTVDAILAAAQLPHAVYRASTAGAIRALGYEAEPTNEGHTFVTFATEPLIEDWRGVLGAFGDPLPNPYKL